MLRIAHYANLSIIVRQLHQQRFAASTRITLY